MSFGETRPQERRKGLAPQPRQFHTKWLRDLLDVLKGENIHLPGPFVRGLKEVMVGTLCVRNVDGWAKILTWENAILPINRSTCVKSSGWLPLAPILGS